MIRRPPRSTLFPSTPLFRSVIPARLAEPMTTLVINNVSCTATFVQYAGLAALTGSQEPVTRMVSGLRAKRDLLVRGLNAIDGVSCATPAGAFYCFPDIGGALERTGLSCESFAERLLAEQHVAVLAGTCCSASSRSANDSQLN